MTSCKIEGCANTPIRYDLCRVHSACDQPKPDTAPDAHDIAARAYVLPPLKYPDADWDNFPDDHPAAREAWCLAALLRRAAADAAKAEREAITQIIMGMIKLTEMHSCPSYEACSKCAEANAMNRIEDAIRVRGTGGA